MNCGEGPSKLEKWKKLAQELESLSYQNEHEEKAIERWERVIDISDDLKFMKRAKSNIEKSLNRQEDIKGRIGAIEIELYESVDSAYEAKSKIEDIQELLKKIKP